MLGKNAIRVLVFLLLQVVSCGDEPCIISAVKKGEPATVTFYFTRDVSQEKEAIVVNNLDHNNGKTVLDCIWETSGFICYSAPGYQREGNITNSLTMKISSFTEEHAGRYACQTLPPLPGDPLTCVLGLEGDKNGPVPVNNLSAGFIVSLSLNAVLLIAVGVLVLVVFRYERVRRKRETKETHEEHSKEMQSLECAERYMLGSIIRERATPGVEMPTIYVATRQEEIGSLQEQRRYAYTEALQVEDDSTIDSGFSTDYIAVEKYEQRPYALQTL